MQLRWLVAATACGLLLQASPSWSQDTAPPSIHWAYASFFGTGWYKISGQQSAFIASFAPTWREGQATWFEGRWPDAVYRVRVPLAFGLTRLDFDDVPGILDPENFSTTSVGISADLDVPLTERFSIRPYAQFSYGTVIGESVYAWTYRADIRARYRFGTAARGWALIGGVGAVSYDDNKGEEDSFTYATLAAEFVHPLRRPSADGDQRLFYWHVAYSQFPNRVGVQGELGQSTEISNYWQAGVAFGKRNTAIKVWFLSFDRLGLAYDISPTGDLRGIKIVFRSIYEP